MTTPTDPEGEYLDTDAPRPVLSDEYARYVAAAITKVRGAGVLEEARAAIAATHRYIIEGGKKASEPELIEVSTFGDVEPRYVEGRSAK